MYIDSKQEREFEDRIGWENIIEANKMIGIALNFEPKVTYSVGDETGSCYGPDASYFRSPESQKVECEKWLTENVKKFPEGWVAKGGYKVKRHEFYPRFHSDWNHLMEAIKRMSDKGYTLKPTPDIYFTWEVVSDFCKTTKL